jgi:hypothetical protein
MFSHFAILPLFNSYFLFSSPDSSSSPIFIFSSHLLCFSFVLVIFIIRPPAQAYCLSRMTGKFKVYIELKSTFLLKSAANQHIDINTISYLSLLSDESCEALTPKRLFYCVLAYYK